MSEYLPDTGVVGEHYCPMCDPDAVEHALERGVVLTPRYCYAHEPDRAGTDDAGAGPGTPRTGSGEAEGADCAAMARLLDQTEQKRGAT